MVVNVYKINDFFNLNCLGVNSKLTKIYDFMWNYLYYIGILQLEFYFGEANIYKSKFMRDLVGEDGLKC